MNTSINIIQTKQDLHLCYLLFVIHISLSIYLPLSLLCLSLTLSLYSSVCLYRTMFDYFSLFQSLSLYTVYLSSTSLCPCLSILLFLYITIQISPGLTICLYFYILCLAHSLLLCIYLSIAKYISLCLFLSLCTYRYLYYAWPYLVSFFSLSPSLLIFFMSVSLYVSILIKYNLYITQCLCGFKEHTPL